MGEFNELHEALLSAKIFNLCSHNDLAEQLRSRFQNQLDHVDLNRNSSGDNVTLWHTDMVRLRAGKVGAQVLHAV